MAQIFKRGNTWSYRVWIDHTHSKSKGGFKRKPDAIAAARELELKKDKKLFLSKVSERTLCGALMIKLYEQLRNSKYSNYYVDVEYNRNNKKIKTCRIENDKNQSKEININCDLIVHSRGNDSLQDNLIAIEMKKSSRARLDKNNDRNRLISLTKECNVYETSQYVCNYKLGIYYEINFVINNIHLEFYYKGQKVFEQKIKY